MTEILIVGGGYAGLYTAWTLERLLRRGEARVTVLDPRPHMTYQPFLPEVASGAVEGRHTVVPLRRHLRRTRVVPGTATRIDHARRTVTARGSEGQVLTLPYDVVVVTAGAVTRTLPVPGIERAVGLKTVEEALEVRDRVQTAFDRAAGLPAGPERAALLTTVVVGGGFTGVELVGELLALVHETLPRYPEIALEEVALHLVEATDRILPEVSRPVGSWVVDHLRSRGAHVHLDTRVTSMTDGAVTLSTGERLEADLAVWAAGNAAAPVVARHTDLPLDARGFVLTRADLRVGTDDTVVADAWAAGDDAAVPDLAIGGGALTVPNAQHAVRQARHLARNLVAQLRRHAVRPYRHRSLGVVATLGRGHGVFQLGPITVKGRLAWWAHRGYHVLAVPGWERKVRVLLGWFAALVGGRDTASLATVTAPRASGRNDAGGAHALDPTLAA